MYVFIQLSQNNSKIPKGRDLEVIAVTLRSLNRAWDREGSTNVVDDNCKIKYGEKNV